MVQDKPLCVSVKAELADAMFNKEEYCKGC